MRTYHVKRFTEQVDITISTERTNEIMDEIRDTTENITELIEKLNTITEELKRYTSNNKPDQLDKAIVKLSQSSKNLGDTITLIDDVMTELETYSKEGRQYII